MAHFAELDENNVVLRVIVVGDQDTSDINGVEDESIGIAFCKKMFGTNTKWKQTSYNNNMRVRYAGIGHSYDEQRDAFILPKPFDSWIFDDQTLDWISPLGLPPEQTEEMIQSSQMYFWDEDLYQSDNTQGWVLRTF